MKTAQNITKWNLAKETVQLGGGDVTDEALVMEEYVRRGGRVLDDEVEDKKAPKTLGKDKKAIKKAK